MLVTTPMGIYSAYKTAQKELMENLASSGTMKSKLLDTLATRKGSIFKEPDLQDDGMSLQCGSGPITAAAGQSQMSYSLDTLKGIYIGDI